MSPLDGVITDYVLPAKVVPDLTRPSLEALAYVLEHVEHWPHDWRWDFSTGMNHCGTAGCALGIAATLWVESAGERRRTDLGDLMSMPPASNDFFRIFHDGMHDPNISPHVVAARIRDHLAGRPIRYK